MMENKYEALREQLILEQYKQAYEQRARDADIQWKTLSFGNTAIGGLLFTALLNSNPLISMILAGAAIPISFFVYAIYRKGLYFENMGTDNIKAIEASIGHLKHVQYDTLPKIDKGPYYVSTEPRKWSVERFSLYSIMTILVALFTVTAMVMFFIYGNMIFPIQPLLAVVVGTLPALYLITIMLDAPTKSKRNVRRLE